MKADIGENYNEFLNDHNIKLKRDQITTKTGVSRTRLKHLVNVLKDISDKVRLYGNKPEERRNRQASSLKILTISEMLTRLQISLAQFKARNNFEKLKMKSGNYCILWADQKKTYQKLYKTLIDII